MTTVASRSPSHADPVCGAAVETARQALESSLDPDAIGDHLETVGLDDRLVEHRFACRIPAYPDWRWCVTVSRAPRSKHVTVNEIDLLPGEDAVLAPAWRPWSDRIQPGDLAPGQVAPTKPDEPALAPGWTGDDELEGELAPGPLHPVNWEPGLERIRVVSSYGRAQAAARWNRSEAGPNNKETRQAPGPCSECGWLLPIGGPIGQQFGLCTNELSPRDGSAVALDHGCGGFSEATPPDLTNTVVTVLDDGPAGWETNEDSAP